MIRNARTNEALFKNIRHDTGPFVQGDEWALRGQVSEGDRRAESRLRVGVAENRN